jgi:acyl carrier protein
MSESVIVAAARELAALVVEALNLEDLDATTIDVTASLFQGGLELDSLDLLEISLVIQQRYGVKLKAGDPNNEAIFASLQSLADHINAVHAARA